MAQVTAEDFFSLGHGAHARGLSLFECPYPVGTTAHELWSEGWRQGRFADRDENVLDAPRLLGGLKSRRPRRAAII